MPSQAMIAAGREQTRRSLYRHFVRLSAEVAELKGYRDLALSIGSNAKGEKLVEKLLKY